MHRPLGHLPETGSWLKAESKEVISSSPFIPEAKPVKPRLTENVPAFKIKLTSRLIYVNQFYKV